MLEKAIKKIKAEMVKNNNPYVQVVGGFLLQYLQVNPNNAEKIIQEGKTIGQSLNEMRKAAEKKKVGNCAVLTDQEGFGEVLKYFGIEGAIPIVVPKPIEVTPVTITQDKKAETEFNVELDF